MILKAIFSVLFLIIVPYGLVSSADKLESDSKPNSEIGSISLSEILSTFVQERHDDVTLHLVFMLVVASYGDHLYELPVNLGSECWRTARANLLMLEKLTTCEEASSVLSQAVNNVTRHLKKQTELLEHPLELVCRQLELGYAADSTLKPLFEKASKDAANFTNVRNRPAYFHKLIKGEELHFKLIEKTKIPEIAKYMAISTFLSLRRSSPRGELARPTLFARACREVAKKEAFAESMQKIFEKTINDILPEFMANDGKNIPALKSGRFDYQTYWKSWVPSMVKIFYGYVAKDAILKKEVEDAAAVIADKNHASKDDLDFSKF